MVNKIGPVTRYYPSDSYYPPEYRQITTINEHIDMCRENQLPTTLQQIVSELGAIAWWCYDQTPQRVTHAGCYEEIIQRANGVIDSLIMQSDTT